MSKLEVKEIGPISGETDLTLGQSGGTVTLADGATAVGFGDPNNLGIVQYHLFDEAPTYAILTWHVLSQYAIQIPEDGVYITTAQVSIFEPSKLKSVRSAIYTGTTVEPIANAYDGRNLNHTNWYTANGGGSLRGESNAPITQRIFQGFKDHWVWLEFLHDNSDNKQLGFKSKSFLDLVRLK